MSLADHVPLLYQSVDRALQRSSVQPAPANSHHHNIPNGPRHQPALAKIARSRNERSVSKWVVQNLLLAWPVTGTPRSSSILFLVNRSLPSFKSFPMVASLSSHHLHSFTFDCVPARVWYSSLSAFLSLSACPGCPLLSLDNLSHYSCMLRDDTLLDCRLLYASHTK